MSEFSRTPQHSIARLAAPFLVAGVAIFGVNKGFDYLNEPEKVGSSGDAISQDISERLQPGKELDVAATIITVASGVNYRRTPVKIDTSNRTMVNGNKISDEPIDLSDNTLVQPTVLIRPALVKNETRFNNDDPKCWIGGLQNDQMVWVGLNKETIAGVHFYQRPQDGELPAFQQTIEVKEVTSDEGVIFDAGDHNASAALIRPSSENDPYIDALKQDGYEEVSFSDIDIDC
jgi:hypothetical protein